jgi:hypothetical protein
MVDNCKSFRHAGNYGVPIRQQLQLRAQAAAETCVQLRKPGCVAGMSICSSDRHESRMQLYKAQSWILTNHNNTKEVLHDYYRTSSLLCNAATASSSSSIDPYPPPVVLRAGSCTLSPIKPGGGRYLCAGGN